MEFGVDIFSIRTVKIRVKINFCVRIHGLFRVGGEVKKGDIPFRRQAPSTL